MTINPVSRKVAWLRVVTLAIAAFIFNTTEFVPVGLLSDIAESFHMQTAQVGIMLTIYAWVVAVMSLPFMLLTSQMERRKLLICLFVLFIASHVLSFLAWNFTVLVISRIGIAFAHAIFWSITASLAIRLAPAGKRAQALSLIATGTALAMVLGLPIGRVVGQYFGWRTTFFAIGMGALITLLCLIKLLPKLPSEHSGSLKSLPLLFRRPALMSLYVLTVVVVTAHYTAYSYIEPFVQNVAGLSANFATVLLLILGGAGIIGSLVFGKLGNRHASSLVSIAIALLVVCLLLLLPAADSEAHLAILSIFWGIAIIRRRDHNDPVGKLAAMTHRGSGTDDHCDGPRSCGAWHSQWNKRNIGRRFVCQLLRFAFRFRRLMRLLLREKHSEADKRHD